MTVALQTAEQALASDRARRGGRAGKRPGGAQAFEQPPFRQLKIPFAPTRLIFDDELESIHLASLRVLKDIGVDVLHDEARRIMKAHGADVRDGSERVRFDSDMILELISHAPAELTLHARNPAHNVRFGGNNLVISQMASASNCSDLDRGRRPGNQADYRNFLKLAQMHNILQTTGGYPVEPVNIHPSIRHLECIRDLATLTDKVFHIYSLGKERNVDGIEITRISRGISREQMMAEPSVYTIINTNSPLKLDVPMMEGIIQMSSMGQVVIVTPFTLSGAMAPVTTAGALVQQNAEALSGLIFTQMVRRGAIQGGANFMLHGAGWLEGGLRCSYEKMILDIDMLQMVAEFLTPLDLSEDALAVDAIRDVGPGGHFFGTAHTQSRYKNAFYSPIISDWRNFETWAEAGSPTAVEKANRVWKERLASYEEPWMDPAIREELNAFVDKRKAEGGAPTDF